MLFTRKIESCLCSKSAAGERIRLSVYASHLTFFLAYVAPTVMFIRCKKDYLVAWKKSVYHFLFILPLHVHRVSDLHDGFRVFAAAVSKLHALLLAERTGVLLNQYMHVLQLDCYDVNSLRMLFPHSTHVTANRRAPGRKMNLK